MVDLMVLQEQQVLVEEQQEQQVVTLELMLVPTLEVVVEE